MHSGSSFLLPLQLQMALISALSSYSALAFIHIFTGFLASYVLWRKYRALILRDRWQHYKLTTSFLTLRIFCTVFIVLNSLLWSEATLKEAAVVWFYTAFLFLIGACVGFIHGGVMVACGDVNTETSKTLRLKKVRQPKSRGKKKELGRDEEKREAGSSEDEVTPQEVQKGKQVSGREFKQPTSVLQQQRKYATDKSTRNTTDRQSSLQDTQTRHRPKRKENMIGQKQEMMIRWQRDTAQGIDQRVVKIQKRFSAAGFPNEDRMTDKGAQSKTKKKNDTIEIGSVYKSGINEHSDTLDNMIPASGSGNTRTEFPHTPGSPTYITARFPNEDRITDRGAQSKTKKKKKNDTTSIDDKVAIVLNSVYKSGSSEHLEELDHSTGASYVASASYHRGPRTKRTQIIGKEPPHPSSQRKPKTDNKWKKPSAKASQNQLIHSPLKNLGQRVSTFLLTPEEQNQRNEEEEEASRDNTGRNNDDVVKQLDILVSGH
ncbi:hypothetical protein BSL78_08323 [Apostichopus japonicus]|uniref:Uncharacterized protein n=1 Tax=Stichopus japonicus TaxID=307972 RepID=A0A2G8L3G9_STIJA|nr:hypothetical protein BSL78_08323 [Apostichopus japonicus]